MTTDLWAAQLDDLPKEIRLRTMKDIGDLIYNKRIEAAQQPTTSRFVPLTQNHYASSYAASGANDDGSSSSPLHNYLYETSQY